MAMKFNINKPLGVGIGVWGANMLEADQMPQFWKDLNPQMKAAALIFAGDFLPKQKFVKGFIKNGDMRDGIGSGLMAVGVQTLLEEFNMLSGVGQSRTQLRDDDILMVAIEGDYDDDDLDVVNADVLSDDDDYYDDDLDVVNADVLSDSHEDDYMDDDYIDDDEDDDDDTVWDD